MNISAGKYKKRRLFYPKIQALRPTTQRVREAVFDRLQTRIEGALFLDLYCGTGAIGLEALSRGAKHVGFIDIKTTYVKRNLEGIDESVEIIQSDVCKALRRYPNKADIIYIDPPWNQGKLYAETLKVIADFDILNEGGLILCEHPKTLTVLDAFQTGKKATYKYGETQLSIFNHE